MSFIDLTKAIKLLQSGNIVAFPTETVYGIGANAFNADAVAKIYAIKGRPASNPLIIHIADKDDIHRVASEIDPISQKLIDTFWPGPLTLILPKHADVPLATTAGLETVAVRMPAHPLAQKLIRACGFPIAAPSANPSGKPSATQHEHVENYFGDTLACITGGSTDKGIESTVVMVRDGLPHILRLGTITPEEIENALGITPILEIHSAHSPGTRFRHYAPNAQLLIIDPDRIKETAKELQQEGKHVGILETENRSLDEVAQHLYDDLLHFDTEHVDIILAPYFPEKGIGLALNDRLQRAAQK